jgi:hypothetical protein
MVCIAVNIIIIFKIFINIKIKQAIIRLPVLALILFKIIFVDVDE